MKTTLFLIGLTLSFGVCAASPDSLRRTGIQQQRIHNDQYIRRSQALLQERSENRQNATLRQRQIRESAVEQRQQARAAASRKRYQSSMPSMRPQATADSSPSVQQQPEQETGGGSSQKQHNNHVISSQQQRNENQTTQRHEYLQTKTTEVLPEPTTLQVKSDEQDSLMSIPSVFPLPNNYTRISSHFGIRRHPIFRKTMMHHGADFPAPTQTLVYATANGIVVHASQKGGYGQTIIIDHENGHQTLYAHLSRIDVRQGQRVKQYEVIGHVGSSGVSTAPHLHYEIILHGRKVNPIYYLPSSKLLADQR